MNLCVDTVTSLRNAIVPCNLSQYSTLPALRLLDTSSLCGTAWCDTTVLCRLASVCTWHMGRRNDALGF